MSSYLNRGWQIVTNIKNQFANYLSAEPDSKVESKDNSSFQKCNMCQNKINQCDYRTRFWYNNNNNDHVHFSDNFDNIFTCDGVACNACKHNVCFKCGLPCYYCGRYLCETCIMYKYFDLNINTDDSNNNEHNADLEQWKTYVSKK